MIEKQLHETIHYFRHHRHHHHYYPLNILFDNEKHIDMDYDFRCQLFSSLTF